MNGRGLYLAILFLIGGNVRSQTTDSFHASEKLLHPPPVVNFYITGLCYGDTTHFISKTDMGEIYWAVTNDKGDTLYRVKSVNATYFFKKKGVYNVCQTADNGHLATKIRTVMVDTVTHAEFYFRPCINEFNNLSTCSDQFVWEMPDNSILTDAFPSYQFKQPGSLPIKLTAKRGNKANTNTKMITVTSDSIGIPDATFTFKRHGTSNVFDFKAVDSLGKYYSWSFGDLTFDDTSGYKVTHAFDMEKYFPPVSLRVANGCGFRIYEVDPFDVAGIDAYSLSDHISVYPNPVKENVAISISGVSPSKKLVLRLMDVRGIVIEENQVISSGDVVSIQWNTAALPPGLYFVQIRYHEQYVNRKLTIQ
jgi:hypothetical protein